MTFWFGVFLNIYFSIYSRTLQTPFCNKTEMSRALPGCGVVVWRCIAQRLLNWLCDNTKCHAVTCIDVSAEIGLTDLFTTLDSSSARSSLARAGGADSLALRPELSN